MTNPDWTVVACPDCEERGRRLMALVVLSWETHPQLHQLRRLLSGGRRGND